jgi:YbbR domain-containing protein
VLAVSLALAGWVYVRLANNSLGVPFDQRLSVPITVVNLLPGYVAQFAQRDAVVTVSSRGGRPPIAAGEIKAVLDLSNKGPGVYNIPVRLTAPDTPVESLSPASVTLTIETAATNMGSAR